MNRVRLEAWRFFLIGAGLKILLILVIYFAVTVIIFPSAFLINYYNESISSSMEFLLGLLGGLIVVVIIPAIIIYEFIRAKTNLTQPYRHARLEIDPDVGGGGVRINWRKIGPSNLIVHGYRYTKALPKNASDVGDATNARLLEVNSKAERDVYRDGKVKLGETGYYSFLLFGTMPGMFSNKPITCDFQTFTVYLPKSGREVEEAREREQVAGIMSSATGKIEKLDALADLESRLLRENEDSARTPTQKEARRSGIARIMKDARDHLMNVVAQKR
jgi:hypothetical protein